MPLPSPPPRTFGEVVRRWWLSQRRHRALRRWLLFRGLPVLLGLGALFLVNGLVIGWVTAYNVLVTIDSPADTANPPLAWLLSLAGWLIGPALAGAIAGHVVTSWIAGRRSRPFVLPTSSDDA